MDAEAIGMSVYLTLLKFQNTLDLSAVRTDSGWMTLSPHLHMSKNA